MSGRISETCDSPRQEANSDEMTNDASPATKLERRRRIEDLFEAKRMREEMGDFDLM